jgi:predicted phage terminase large subunit-like protein
VRDILGTLTDDELADLERRIIDGDDGLLSALYDDRPDLTDDEQSERLLCETSYAEFYRRIVWPVIGDCPLLWNWHLDLIAEHLEAVYRREIKHLLCNIPPGCSKSICFSVGYNAWVWTTQPQKRFFSLAYHQNLVSRDCRNTRYVVQSEKYQRYWGHMVQLRGDQNTTLRYDTLAGGWRIGSTVAGQVIGEHPSGGIIIDDPHNVNVRKVDTDDRMKSVGQWYDQGLSTRGKIHNCPHILVMQRLKHVDLSGHIIRKPEFAEDWVHLRVPMRYEPKHTFHSPLGWCDPRTEPGELLWPNAFPDSEVRQLERQLGPLGSAGQLQQRPTPLKGSFFKVANIGIVQAWPREGRTVRYWDLAGTQDAGAYTVGVLMRQRENQLYVGHVARKQLEPGRRNAFIRRHAEIDNARYPGVITYVEQEPGSSGKESAINLCRLLRPYPCRRDRVSGDKATRAIGYSSAVEVGDVFLVEGTWNQEYLDELDAFPRGGYKDQVDASSGAENKLSSWSGGVGELIVSGEFEGESEPLSEDEMHELPQDIREALEGLGG